MDCHLAYDGNPDTSPSASANACTKVQNRFVQITGLAVLSTSQAERIALPGRHRGLPLRDDEYQCEGELSCDEGDPGLPLGRRGDEF